MRKPTIWVPTRSDTNRAVQSQKQARSLKFRIYEEEGLCYPCRENKGADQLRGHREADLRLCFRICRLCGGSDSCPFPKCRKCSNKIKIVLISSDKLLKFFLEQIV